MTEHLFHGAEEGIRTPDPLITNQLLWPTELRRQNFFAAFFQKILFQYSSVKISFPSFDGCKGMAFFQVIQIFLKVFCKKYLFR